MSHRTISLDVSAGTIKDLNIGDKFEATVKGKITELEGERRFEGPMTEGGKKGKDEVFPPRVTVELASVDVTQPNEFSELVKDDED